MPYFSKILDDEQKQKLQQDAPGWLRLKYEKEVFSHFIFDYELSEMYSFDPLPLLRLCDDLCIGLKLDKPITTKRVFSKQRDYISEILRTCHWYHFYDFIEIVGDLLMNTDDEFINLHNKAVDEENWDILDYSSLDLPVKLEKYGFNTYLSKVNFLFSTNWPRFGLMPNGRIAKIDNPNDADEMMRNYVTIISGEPNSGIPITYKPKTEIDWLLESIEGSSLSKTDRDSLENASVFFYEEKYRDTLSILDIVMESIINVLIEKQGRTRTEFFGLKKKLQFLSDCGVLNLELVQHTGIITRRNLSTHESYAPGKQYLEPMCQISFRFIKDLLSIK